MEQTDIVKGAVKSPRHAFTSSCFLWNFIRLVGVKPYVKKDHRFFKNMTAFKKNAVAFGIKRHGVFKKGMDVGSASGLHNKIHHFLLIIYELES